MEDEFRMKPSRKLQSQLSSEVHSLKWKKYIYTEEESGNTNQKKYYWLWDRTGDVNVLDAAQKLEVKVKEERLTISWATNSDHKVILTLSRNNPLAGIDIVLKSDKDLFTLKLEAYNYLKIMIRDFERDV